MADTVKVVFAVYGALTDGWYDEGEQSVRRMTAMAGDVASTLQTLLNNTPNKVVTINNANMSPGGVRPLAIRRLGLSSISLRSWNTTGCCVLTLVKRVRLSIFPDRLLEFRISHQRQTQ